MTRKRDAWKDFGEAVIAARGQRGWSQRDLAAEAGISPTTVGAIERGQSDPTSAKAAAVAAALGWPADAGRRWLAGDRDFADTELMALAAKYDRLTEQQRQQILDEMDRLLGED